MLAPKGKGVVLSEGSDLWSALEEPYKMTNLHMCLTDIRRWTFTCAWCLKGQPSPVLSNVTLAGCHASPCQLTKMMAVVPVSLIVDISARPWILISWPRDPNVGNVRCLFIAILQKSHQQQPASQPPMTIIQFQWHGHQPSRIINFQYCLNLVSLDILFGVYLR